jgi:hypothetical protein
MRKEKRESTRKEKAKDKDKVEERGFLPAVFDSIRVLGFLVRICPCIYQRLDHFD